MGNLDEKNRFLHLTLLIVQTSILAILAWRYVLSPERQLSSYQIPATRGGTHLRIEGKVITQDGERDWSAVRKQQLRGNVALAFVSTECGVCLQEIPELKLFHDRLKQSGALVVVCQGDSLSCRFYYMNKSLPFEYLIVDKAGTEVFAQNQVFSVPQIFVLDSSDSILASHIGPLNLSSAEKLASFFKERNTLR